MPLLNTSIPNLIQGVSQQPPSVRFDGQCELQENAVGSTTQGLMKRPPTEFIKEVLNTDANMTNAFIGFIDRDDDEAYVMVVQYVSATKCTLRVFHAQTGTEAITSNLPSGYGEFDQNHYLFTDNPKRDLKILTVGDTTFILNKSKTVGNAFGSSNGYNAGGTSGTNHAIVFIKQGDYEKEYSITITNSDSSGNPPPNDAGKTIRYTIKSGTSEDDGGDNASTKTIREKWFATNGLSNESAVESGSTLNQTQLQNMWNSFTRTRIGDSAMLIDLGVSSRTISVSDGLAGTGIGLVFNEVDNIVDLPTTAPHGFKVKVNGDADTGADDYYVEFQLNDLNGVSSAAARTARTIGNGSWIETTAPFISDTLNNTTLPMSIVLTGYNTNTNIATFEANLLGFNKRTAGDDDTNPVPSFVGNKINHMFLFKNRLGFLADDKVVLSEAGLGSLDDNGNQQYNFFRTTVTSLLDGDPIDIAVATDKVTVFQNATQFQKDLIIFSDNGQFVLKGGDILSPRTVSITRATVYESNSDVDPIGLGQYLYFPFSRGSFSGVKEFLINADSDVYYAEEISSHVPSYIPPTIVSFTGSEIESFIAITDGSDIYIYKYFFSGQKKLLGAWSKFTVAGTIKGIEFIRSNLYILTVKNSKTNLLKLNLQEGLVDTAQGYNTNLDMRYYTTVNANTNTITLPYTPENSDVVQVVDTDGKILVHTLNGNTITLAVTPTVNTNVYVGLQYLMKYQFTELVYKAQAGQSKTPSRAVKLLVRNGSLFYNDTAAFDVKVTPKGRSTYTNTFSPFVVGQTIVGENSLDSGSYRFPIMTQAQDTTITIENNTPLPSNFQSAEFEAFSHGRSQRYG